MLCKCFQGLKQGSGYRRLVWWGWGTPSDTAHTSHLHNHDFRGWEEAVNEPPKFRSVVQEDSLWVLLSYLTWISASGVSFSQTRLSITLRTSFLFPLPLSLRTFNIWELEGSSEVSGCSCLQVSHLPCLMLDFLTVPQQGPVETRVQMSPLPLQAACFRRLRVKLPLLADWIHCKFFTSPLPPGRMSRVSK